MFLADAPSASSVLWDTGSRDAVSRPQGHLEHYTEVASLLESEGFSGSWHVFEAHGSHGAQES